MIFSSAPRRRLTPSAACFRFSALGRGCRWLPLGGGCGVGDGQPDGPVAEVGYQVQPAAEGLGVAGDDLKRGDLAMLDLEYPGDAHPHGGGDLFLAQAQLLSGLGKLMPARLGQQLARTSLDFLRRDPGSMQLVLKVSQFRGCASAWRLLPS